MWRIIWSYNTRSEIGVISINDSTNLKQEKHNFNSQLIKIVLAQKIQNKIFP